MHYSTLKFCEIPTVSSKSTLPSSTQYTCAGVVCLTGEINPPYQWWIYPSGIAVQAGRQPSTPASPSHTACTVPFLAPTLYTHSGGLPHPKHAVYFNSQPMPLYPPNKKRCWPSCLACVLAMKKQRLLGNQQASSACMTALSASVPMPLSPPMQCWLLPMDLGHVQPDGREALR